MQVYSRKVEYLYSLVLHALEFISQKRFVFVHFSFFFLKKNRIFHALNDLNFFV